MGLQYGGRHWSRTNRLLFEKVACTVAILTAGAMRTTPTKALFAILNWLPVDPYGEAIGDMDSIKAGRDGYVEPKTMGSREHTREYGGEGCNP
ncbi:hypothetical protein EVAR_73510_1 [Eumeta japonica]|uniref:Uncharacterized protein n=1 Tax=Eumeta variegata TaxID=151549 RepID=A0A4C1SZF9_EUMVA|nr:hypothetical protein EVAR_73510_1 [Eumeta japonica]